MKLLALDTATEACSVALYLDGQILERHAIAPRQQAERILPWIAEVLAEAGLARRQLDAIACGRGPGAFTGVRLAVALVQGLGLALDRPVLGISTLQALALPAMRALDARGDTQTAVIAALDARMDEVYLACHQRDAQGQWQQAGEEIVIAPDAVDGPDAPYWTGVGSGFAACDAALVQRLGHRLRHYEAAAWPHAADIARLAVDAFQRGHALAPEDLQPAYLRNKVALTLREQGQPVPQAWP